jgi:apolipoprotein N-acyltransferase
VLLPTVAGAAGILICNEAMLPEVAAARVAAGAAYLVNPANDSWLDDPTYAALQFDIVSLRAVEQRRWLVRASTSGPSALVDPWGRIVAESRSQTRDLIAGALEARADRTPYGRVGDAFAGLCLAATLVGLVHATRGRRLDPRRPA